jgi:hypothetical protein
MSKKLLMVLAAVLIAAVFIVPAGAQFCSPFGFGFGISPFGTSVATGFTTVSSFTSGFTAVNGVAVPFGFGCGVPFGGFGLGGCGFGTGLGFGGFSPFGFC